jgi:AraC-like DNA-binding protein
MEPFKEDLVTQHLDFPVDVFISNNLKETIVSNPHWHDCCEILYMLEGSAEQQVNDQIFRVGKNDLIILAQGDIHSTTCRPGEPVSILVIKFLPGIIENGLMYLTESQYIQAFLNNKRGKIFHIQDTVKSSADIYELMMGLYREYSKRDPGFEMYMKGYIYQLIASLIRGGIIKADPVIRESDALCLNRLLKHIEQHYKENINLEEAANMMNMSYSYLSRYFKKVTGRNFKEYLDFVRICEVEKLLLTKRMNISEAAYEAGYSNVSSFNRVFKRIRGYTPGDIKWTRTAKK